MITPVTPLSFHVRCRVSEATSKSRHSPRLRLEEPTARTGRVYFRTQLCRCVLAYGCVRSSTDILLASMHVPFSGQQPVTSHGTAVYRPKSNDQHTPCVSRRTDNDIFGIMSSCLRRGSIMHNDTRTIRLIIANCNTKVSKYVRGWNPLHFSTNSNLWQLGRGKARSETSLLRAADHYQQAYTLASLRRVLFEFVGSL